MTMLNANFSFTTLANVFRQMTKKLPVKEIIKEYKHVIHKKITNNLNVFYFELSPNNARKFEGLLSKHGMTICKSGYRSGVSKAMQSILKTL